VAVVVVVTAVAVVVLSLVAVSQGVDWQCLLLRAQEAIAKHGTLEALHGA
jgi:hypothetical protein